MKLLHGFYIKRSEAKVAATNDTSSVEAGLFVGVVVGDCLVVGVLSVVFVVVAAGVVEVFVVVGRSLLPPVLCNIKN